MKNSLSALSLPVLLSLPLVSFQSHSSQSHQRLLKSAKVFLNELGDELRAKAILPFKDERRTQWSYFPGGRPGVSLQEMTNEQRRLAHDLLRDWLSTSGYLKATGIMHLEEALRAIERSRGRRASSRDPELYYFNFFGTPAPNDPWGWRIEGHHLSLNFTIVAPPVRVACTPLFLGTNPAEVPTGPEAGWRILAAQEDLARELLGSLDKQQLATAVISDRAPNDIIMSPRRKEMLGEPVGLPVAKMKQEQRTLVLGLIDEYLLSLRRDLAAPHLDRIRKAGFDEIRFAWAGSTDRRGRHYYRLHGKNFVIEFDQVGANHVHTVFRDLEHDFGGDLLRQHYEKHHRKGPDKGDGGGHGHGHEHVPNTIDRG